jgi:chromosome transmission fidelity protein 1
MTVGETPPRDLDARVARALSGRFSFPFTPYPCQLSLMRAAYRTMELGGVGVLESPTGTGKTMSLSCVRLVIV